MGMEFLDALGVVSAAVTLGVGLAIILTVIVALLILVYRRARACKTWLARPEEYLVLAMAGFMLVYTLIAGLAQDQMIDGCEQHERRVEQLLREIRDEIASSTAPR